jgi:hypothetical protein
MKFLLTLLLSIMCFASSANAVSTVEGLNDASGIDATHYYQPQTNVIEFNPPTITNPIVVEPQRPKSTAKWTIMVYVVGKNNLSNEGCDDVAEMEKVGSNKNLNIFREINLKLCSIPI